MYAKHESVSRKSYCVHSTVYTRVQYWYTVCTGTVHSLESFDESWTDGSQICIGIPYHFATMPDLCAIVPENAPRAARQTLDRLVSIVGILRSFVRFPFHTCDMPVDTQVVDNRYVEWSHFRSWECLRAAAAGG